MQSIAARIASELTVRPEQVAATVALLDEGASVPFIARYRKEVPGSLDDPQLRYLEERLRYLRELEDRRSAVLSSIAEQGKLSPELERDIREADTKTRLEDLYLPYKPKRRTKGQIAIEAGLEPLADALFDDPTLDPEQQAAAFVDADKGVADVKAALDGAKYILMERFAENASLLERLRSALREDGRVASRLVAGKEQEGAKFADYFEYDEPLKKVPSHRALAILRGRNEGVLSIALELGDAEPAPGSLHPCEGLVAETVGISNQGRAADRWLNEVVRWTWRVKLLGHLETELLGELAAELQRCAADSAVRAVVITGSRKAFAAGADLNEMAERDLVGMLDDPRQQHWQRITRFPKPLIAAVNGYALGGGCELAMHADILIAGNDAQFGQPEINLGIMPGAGGTQRLLHAVGKSLAMQMVLAGEAISARRALEAGLVSEITQPEFTVERALQIAQRIADKAPLAVRLAKEAVLKAQDLDLASGLRFERHAFTLLAGTADRNEGIRAFQEKRRADFHGR